eukprot:5703751-Amphidinium_carterae.1
MQYGRNARFHRDWLWNKVLGYRQVESVELCFDAQPQCLIAQANSVEALESRQGHEVSSTMQVAGSQFATLRDRTAPFLLKCCSQSYGVR